MRMAVDVMGGDHGPGVVVDGARLALQACPSITEMFLVGKEDEIKSAMRSSGLHDSRARILHASEILSMDDKPVEAVRRKKDCSIVRAVGLLKERKADALISTGNTGGILAASTIGLRLLEGIDRAAIAAVIPTQHGEFVLIDAGASVECRPNHLLHFAVMGSIYSREVLGRKNPRVGILSNGTEANKGTETTQEAFKLCKMTDLNFIGYVEGHHLFHQGVEVVVCDGFIGNVVLKSLESFAKGLYGWIQHEISQSPKRMLGGMLVKGALRTIKRRMDPDAAGGAPLLGLNGVVIKVHGSSRERAIMNGIGRAVQSVEHHITEMIVRETGQYNQRLTPAPA